MKSPADDADARLWSIVAATVRPLKSRSRLREGAAIQTPGAVAATPGPAPAVPGPIVIKPGTHASAPARKAPRPQAQSPPQTLEPGRRRRLERGRDKPAAVVDLHGLTQDEARATLTGFVIRAVAEHQRNILVITGKGALGDGVLRRRAPEWLAEPPLRQLVAGLSEAHRRHGGGGALYVALKRG